MSRFQKSSQLKSYLTLSGIASFHKQLRPQEVGVRQARFFCTFHIVSAFSTVHVNGKCVYADLKHQRALKKTFD